jgi:hypothetical protein
MNDAIAIALEVVTVGMRGLRKAASAGALDVHRVGGQHGKRIALLMDDWMTDRQKQPGFNQQSEIINQQFLASACRTLPGPA